MGETMESNEEVKALSEEVLEDTEVTSDEKTWAMFAHLSILLGAVTVGIRETFEWFSPTAYRQYCTITGGSSPAYAQRCYRITPTTDPTNDVSVRLWGLSDELNGIAESSLAVYRNTGGSTWVELTNRFTGNDGGSYSYAQGDTSDFSAFLLGETGGGNTPTAVTLRQVTLVRLHRVSLATIGVGLCVAALGVATVRRRRKV